jgi:hypothetical protein
VCSFASRLAALVALACSLLPAQDFESTNEPLPPPFAATLDVGTGRGTFAVVDGALRFRDRGDAGAGVDVPATTPCGRVHALTQVPSGTVVVACERGLFVCDVQHPVLDPADVRDGGPRGEVRSVVADATGRVWWCNEHELGVVDLRLRCGRRFTASDGLPSAPLQRVALGFDHRLVVVTANGTFGYRIDRGAPPALVGELPATVVANADGDATLPITVRAHGGGTLRVRRKHHHMVQPLDGQLVRGLRPGRHVLEVRAFDRDLRSTVLGECTVDVPLPGRFDVRWLFGAAGLAVMVVWWWAWRARPGSGFRRVAGASLRAALVAIAGLQLVAALLGYGRAWPFVGFSMYTETWHEHDVVFRPRIVGVRADGERVPLHEHQVGVHQDGYWQMLAEVAFGGDAAARAFFAKVARCRRPDDPPFTGFLLADGRIRLTAGGPVDVAPTVLVAWSER